MSLDQLTAAWPAGVLRVAALDVGLGWPAPTPRPDDPTGLEETAGDGVDTDARGGGGSAWDG